MAVLPFAWMYGDPAEVRERMEEEIEPMLKIEMEREVRNKRRSIRALVKGVKSGRLKGQR